MLRVGLRGIESGKGTWSSNTSRLSQTASWTPLLSARYFDSVEDRETVGYLLLGQLIGPPPMVKMYTSVEHLVSTQLP